MTAIKICGLKRREDLQLAIDLAVDYVGFVTYAPSPRSVTLQELKGLLQDLPAERPKTVAVMVNPSVDEVHDALNDCGVDYIQFHGDEELSFCQQWPEDRWIKALRPREPLIGEWEKVSSLLIDAVVESGYGGQGILGDWSIADRLKKTYNGRLFLAGGLNASNVNEAIRVVGPDVVDVSSGVEQSPGIKDEQAMRLFVQHVKEGK